MTRLEQNMQNSVLVSCLSILVFHFSRESALLKYRRALLWQALNTRSLLWHIYIQSDQIRASTSGWRSIWLMVILNENIHPAGQLGKNQPARHLIGDRHWAERFCLPELILSAPLARTVISLEAAKGEWESDSARPLYIRWTCMQNDDMHAFDTTKPFPISSVKNSISARGLFCRTLCAGAVPHISLRLFATPPTSFALECAWKFSLAY